MSQSIASEVVSAMVGGMFSASALYPLEVLKTRMQAETKQSANKKEEDEKNEKEEDDDEEEEEKGCQCPCIGCQGCALRKVLPNEQEGKERDDDPEEDADMVTTKNNKNSSSSSFSNSSSTILIQLTPEEKKEQARKAALKEEYQHAAMEGMGAYASLMFENEGGITPFYTGVVTSAIQSATEKALYFFAYTFLKNGYVNLTGDSNIGTVSNLILGCFAEWAHLPVTLPIDCLSTAIQTDDRNRGVFVLMGSILSEKGIAGFYKGIQAYTVLCLKPAIQYTVYEQVKKIVITARRVQAHGRPVDDSLSAPEAFFLGMFARIVATMLTYPYLRAKVMLQSTYGSAKNKPTIPQMIAEQLSHGGVWGLYQGIGPELTRGVFSAALMMMVKERIGVVVRALIDGPPPGAAVGAGASNRMEVQREEEK